VARLARATRWAGEASGGLVDATLAREIEAAGYAASRTGLTASPLADALAAAPVRRPARALAHPGFAQVSLQGALVARPPGLRLDSGGLGKGLAADVAAELVPGGVRYAISAGGDLAVGGGDWEVAVAGAIDGAEVHRLRLGRGGVATSGIHERLWQRDDGRFAHHLLDPSTGKPAWTGLVAATAAGASALEAEVLAKTALLSGPVAARRVLRRRGGVLQHDDGRVEVLAPAPVVRLPRPGAAARGSAAPRSAA
jgi:thiamine biosynthesis lipoprotein